MLDFSGQMSNKLDLLLINIGGTKKKVYQDLSKSFSAVEPPFWAALTAGFVRKKGYSVDILDAGAENLDQKETAEFIKNKNPNLAEIVVYSQQANVSTPIMYGVRELCFRIKSQEPNRKIILSGWHPSALPEKTMQEEKCDFVIEGEGFYSLEKLLENKKLNEIPGLWYRKNGKICSNPREKNIEDLTSELSNITWDLLPLTEKKYRAFNWLSLGKFETRNKFASLSTSLGCPYKCDYCAIHATFGERKIRYWKPEWVLKQIDTLVQDYGIKHLKIIDELFIFNPKHYVPIVEGLIERDYGLNICAFARVDSVNNEKNFERLKKAGFNWIELGIETGSDEIRKNVSKGNYSLADIKSSVKKIKDAGSNICGNFMFGLPGDTHGTMQKTLDLAIELNCEFPSFFCTMAVPGSDLYKKSVQNNLELPDSWIGYASQGYEFLPLSTKTLSPAEILAFRDKAFNTYFTNPKYLNFIENKFGLESRRHIEDMTKIKLKRKILGD